VGRIIGKNGKLLEDMITVMSLDGEVLEEISMLDVIHNSGLIGLYQGATGTTADTHTTDPLHLNAVREVGQRVASAHDWLNANDLLVSFRSINSIAIIDRPTLLVKWHTAGTTLRQHSPRFVDSGDILVFDNLGGDASLGGTRLVKIGLQSRLAETIYPTPQRQPSARVYSETAGHLDLHRDGNVVLMAVANHSKVIEVDLEGTVLWEYRFVDPTTKKSVELQTAKYCYGVSFEMNQSTQLKGVDRLAVQH
jgi:hypothetical protein